MTIFAVDEHDREDLPWPVPATHWFWQAPNRWVAVYAEFHDDWWEGADRLDIVTRPEPWQLPIDQMPDNGMLVYRDVMGDLQQRTVARKRQPDPGTDLGSLALLQDFIQHGVPTSLAAVHFTFEEHQIRIHAVVETQHEFERILDPQDQDGMNAAMHELIDFMQEIREEKP